MAFNVALSGLNSAISDMEITAHNIANANTTGFKYSRGEFVDLYASAGFIISNIDPGDGVRLSAVRQQFSQGNIAFTGSGLDMAIAGTGFFSLSDATGSRIYSRAGSFAVDRDGFVVNAQNARLQVFDVVNADELTFNNADTVDLQLVTSEGAPNPTSAVDLSFNLQADAPDLGAGAIDPTDADTYSYSTSMTLFDSLGVSHTATVFFRRTGNLTWDSRLVIDDDVAQTSTVNTLTFDATGALSSATPVSFGAYTPTNGADPLDVSFDMRDATSFGSGFSINNIFQDGFTTGRLSNVDIDENGIVFARFSNGQSEPLGKIALARFPNEQGLRPVGDSAWVESFSSGQSIIGEPGDSGLGFVQSGSIENSNVNLSEQLVNLINAQRNFQANAQVITTADQLNQTLLNIR